MATMCHLNKYKNSGTTWAQVVEEDPAYVKFILYKTHVPLEIDLVQALEDALEE